MQVHIFVFKLSASYNKVKITTTNTENIVAKYLMNVKLYT